MESAKFWQGIEQFNQKEFYACHDTLETLWMEASEPDKTFYQGILQIAVACYHLGNSNWRGTVILLGEGIRKLRNYQPNYREIDVTNLVDISSNLLETLQQIPPAQISQFVLQLNLTNNDLNVKYPQVLKFEQP